jgi:hypothetical protein
MKNIRITKEKSLVDAFLNRPRHLSVLLYLFLGIVYDYLIYWQLGPDLKIRDTPMANVAWLLLLFPIGFLVNAISLGITWRKLRSLVKRG